MKENEFDKIFKWLLLMKESVFGYFLDIYIKSVCMKEFILKSYLS